jgi:asparagine N-glycosylation enzyme membrane subunit Stt3
MTSGWILFCVLLAAALLLAWLEHMKPKEPRDYRVVHFTLRLSLTFGIGAVIVAIVLVLASLGVIPNLGSG